MSRALIPGSFDPVTVGHLDIIKRALSLYGEVVVAVMVNDQKQYAFTMEEREEMVRLAVADLSAVRVVSDAGLLVDLFERVQADVIVKGVRNEQDRAYEEQMASWNLARNPRAKTVFLEAADDFESVNSTAVRTLLHAGESADALLPPAVAAYARAALEKRKNAK